ncbi:hypothetical protein B6D29_02920 [Microgenomates bacterium UTCPR1]|nr:MAG: hypothetical protein B6D29_02920 [Microgenomates bacterium UTCPR1]
MAKDKITPTQRALNLWAIILIVWAGYRTYFRMPEWFDEFIAKPMVFVLPVFYYIKKFEKKSLSEGLNLRLKPSDFLCDLVDSLIIGGVFLFTAVFGLYLREKKLILVSNFPGMEKFFMIALTALATGVTEEILSRGFVLKRLYDESKNVLGATFFSSILFFFLHIPVLFVNPKINGNMLLIFLVTDLFLSMISGLIFIQKKSLTAPILIHAFYNIVISLAFI